MPPPEERDVRVLVEHRHQLVELRTRAKNGLQAMALGYGLRRRGRLWSARGRKELEKIPLREGMARRRRDLTQLLDQLSVWIKELDQRIAEEVARREDAQRLMTHPGIGTQTALATVLILGLERHGFRPLEAVIAVLVGVVSGCYVIETILDRPDWLQVLPHAVIPGFAGTESVLLATGILGATVMPHVIYLHSALTQNRIVPESDDEARRLMRYTRVDVVVAMTIAGLINMAMLIMAAVGLLGDWLLGRNRSALEMVAGAAAARRRARCSS